MKSEVPSTRRTEAGGLEFQLKLDDRGHSILKSQERGCQERKPKHTRVLWAHLEVLWVSLAPPCLISNRHFTFLSRDLGDPLSFQTVLPSIGN